MINFGIEGKGLGVFLVLLNLTILALAGWLAYAGLMEQRNRNFLKEHKVNTSFFSFFLLCLLFDIVWCLGGGGGGFFKK
jgi:hypothetical protein